jgi:hypothetical protein
MVMKEIEKLTPKEEFLSQFKETYLNSSFPEEWDMEKRRRVMAMVSPGKTKSLMFTSIPMVCRAEKCMFAESCPMQKEGIAPKGYACPYESGIISSFVSEYMEQLDIEPDNLVELSMIRDLVDQDVQYLRKTKILAQEDFIQENVVGRDGDGNPIFAKQLHIASELEDKLHKRRSVIFKQLLATREAKAKVGMATLDTAQSMANLVFAYRQVESQKETALKQKLGIIEQDDYIDIPQSMEDD